ncbi:hypothetical protein KY290_019538 [Solanum tuberosum]|uniref:DUF4283 domain-containing protein n=1 Tax=Solanum tuberosum TaxID=4113 RepID=A0ABQ7VKC7_SOLTU|nr:hypothetical protein KY290_019538 [Solanum tuberosum]
MDGGITGGKESGEPRTQVTGVHEKFGKGTDSSPLDIHLTDISSNLEGGNTNNTQSVHPDEDAMNSSKGTSRKTQAIDNNKSFLVPDARTNDQLLSALHTSGTPTTHEETHQMQEMAMNIQHANAHSKRNQITESSTAEAQSSNFSFGIRGNSMNVIPNDNPSVMQDASQGRTMEIVQLDQQRQNVQTSQSRQSKGKEVQTGHKDKEGQKNQNEDANHQGGTSRTQLNSTKATREYQDNFPRISNNFARYDPNLPKSKTVDNQASINVGQVEKNLSNQQQSRSQNPKQDNIPEPAPFTIVQSFAARLRYNQSKNETPIVLNSPVHTTRQGLPVVLLDEDDYNIKLAESCKHTLVGKFTNTMPKMELIRKSFTLQTQLTGGVKITHFNSRHVYIDLDNEFDYVTVWTKQRMSIEGQLMRIQTWTPDFTPEEEAPIVPVWVALPELPWHCYNKVVLTTILSSIGKVLYLNSPSSQKTRGSMARVKIQIDLTKERPPHIWLGFKNSDPNKGRWQKIQYEGIPDYCHYCKHQGHVENVCTIKRRDDEFQKRKEMEAEKKSKTKGEQEKGINKNQVQDHSKSATQATQQSEQREDCRPGENTKQVQQHILTTQVQIHQEQEVGDQEEHWQIQRKKQNKNQEQSNPKTVWRPVSPQQKGAKNSKQQETTIRYTSYNSYS